MALVHFHVALRQQFGGIAIPVWVLRQIFFGTTGVYMWAESVKVTSQVSLL